MTPDRPVLLCFDGSGGARRAVVEAAGLLGPRRAVVLSIWQPARELTPLDPFGDVVGRLSGLYADLDEAGMEVARGIAAEGVELAEAAGFSARARVQCGRPAATITRVAEEIDAAAIVLGARGLSPAGAMLGSVSGRVCRHARRPVVVVPPAVLGEADAQPGGTVSPAITPRTL
ncbi:MAG: universal stress protein [Solirubrobacteraceae bacterium]